MTSVFDRAGILVLLENRLACVQRFISHEASADHPCRPNLQLFSLTRSWMSLVESHQGTTRRLSAMLC